MLSIGALGLLSFSAFSQLPGSSGDGSLLPDPSGRVTPTSVKELKATDRFGNTIEPETMNVSAASRNGNTCQAGHFTLCFEDVDMNRDYGFDDPILGAQRQSIVCRVFTDLSALIQSPIPAGGVRILVAASEGTDNNNFTVNQLSSSAAAVASDINLQGFSNGITYGMVWQALVSGNDPYFGLQSFGYGTTSFHGFIRVNFADIPFHLVDFGNVTQPVPTNEMDLYSVTLHEAMHLLGFYSLIDATNNNQSVFSSNGNTGLYNRYDLQLELQQGGGVPLINYVAPYSATPTNLQLNNAPANCAYSVNFDGSATPNQPVYMPSGANWSGSGLSHLNCSSTSATGCATGNGYIMNTCLLRGTAQRHPHQNEVNMLCDLGYTVPSNTFFGTATSATSGYQNFEQYNTCSSPVCLPTGVNDAANATVGNALSISETTLISNDINTTSIHASSFEVLGGTMVGTPSFSSGTLTFTPSPLFSGTALIRYLPMCNGTPGSFTYIAIDVPASPAAACNLPVNSCNIVCHGDMENINAVGQNSFYDLIFNGLAHDNSPNYLFPGSYNYPFPTQLCGITAPSIPSTLSVQAPNTAYASISCYSSPVESLGFDLTQALQSGVTYELSFLSSTGCAGHDLAVVFSADPPCPKNGTDDLNLMHVTNPTVLGTSVIPGNVTSICPSYNPEFWVNAPISTPVSGSSWVRNTVQFSNVPAGTQLDHMIVFVRDRYNGHIAFDDFTLERVSPDQLDITSTVSTLSCEGDQLQISYEICSNQAVSGLTLNAQLPIMGLQFGAGGDFINGQASNISVPANGCTTVTLNVAFDAGTLVGTSFPVQLNATGSAQCVSTQSQTTVAVTRQAPISSPLALTVADLTNAAPYQTGNIIDLQVQFTNTDPALSVTNIVNQVQLPAGFALASSNMPASFNVAPLSTSTYLVQVEVLSSALCSTEDVCITISEAQNACDIPRTECVSIVIEQAVWPLFQIEASKGIVKDLHEDADGYVYSTGHFVNVSFQGTPLIGSSFFLAKTDDCDEIDWVRRTHTVNGTGHSDSYSVTQDAAGDVYVSGKLNDRVRFEGGNNPDITTIQYDQVLNGTGDFAFIAKYSAAGDLIWVMQLANPSFSEWHEVQYDPATGYMYATGTVDHNHNAKIILYTNGSTPVIGLAPVQLSWLGVNRAVNLISFKPSGALIWTRTQVQNKNSFGRYLEFKKKAIVVAGDKETSYQDASTLLLNFSKAGTLLAQSTHYPAGLGGYRAHGLAIDARGDAFVQTSNTASQIFLSKYSVSSSGIFPIYSNSAQAFSGYSPMHALASDLVNDRLIFQLGNVAPAGAIFGIDPSVNTWSAAWSSFVIHEYFLALPGTMTRGTSGNVYSGGHIPGTATFNLFGAPLTATSVGFKDFYITRHLYNGGAATIFGKDGSQSMGRMPEVFIDASTPETTGMQMYPNPANSEVLMAFDLKGDDELIELAVVDITGRSVLSGTYTVSGNDPVRINTSSLVSGTYFVQVSGSSIRETKQLIIQH